MGTRVAIAVVPTPAGEALKRALLQRITWAGDIEVVGEDTQDYIMIVGGGDGFLLETVQRTLGRARGYFGINLGTVGFMMNDFGGKTDEQIAEEIIEFIRTNSFQTVMHPVLRAEIQPEVGEKFVRYAANDVVVRYFDSDQAVRLDIAIDNVSLPIFSGDGVILGTPAGSTAYTLSAGGSPIDHRLKCFSLTPIAPQMSAEFANLTKPVILSPDAKVVINVLERDKRPVRCSIDTSGWNYVKSVSASLDKEKEFSLLYLPDWNYLDRLSRKIFGVKERRR